MSTTVASCKVKRLMHVAEEVGQEFERVLDQLGMSSQCHPSHLNRGKVQTALR